MMPRRIFPAPGSLVSATQPQANGYLWMLAGTSSMGLFEMDSSTGHLTGSVSVSGAARSVAETSTGVIGLALGTARTGALELLSSIGKVFARPFRCPRLLDRSWWAVTALCSTC